MTFRKLLTLIEDSDLDKELKVAEINQEVIESKEGEGYSFNIEGMFKHKDTIYLIKGRDRDLMASEIIIDYLLNY